MQCGKWFLILINFLVALLGVAIMIFAGVGYGRLTDYSDLCKDCSAAVAVLIICLGGLVRIKNMKKSFNDNHNLAYPEVVFRLH